MAKLLYGTGMRLMECVRLRVKDVEFEKKQVVVLRHSKLTGTLRVRLVAYPGAPAPLTGFPSILFALLFAPGTDPGQFAGGWPPKRMTR